MIKAKKLNMSQIFMEDGKVVPVTWVELKEEAENLQELKTVDVIGISKEKVLQGLLKDTTFRETLLPMVDPISTKPEDL